MKKIFLLSLGIAILAIGACAEKPESSGVIEVDGIKLPYFIEGKGIPCVIAGDARLTAGALSKELRKHFRFIVTDFRMNVPSDKSVEIDKITMDTFLDDVEQVRRSLNFDKVCVLGHSISGILALEYARKYPQHTSAVIMHGTPPYWNARAIKMGNEYWESHASEERKMILERKWEKVTEDTLDSLSAGQADILRYITNGPKYWYEPTYDCSWLLEGIYWNAEVWNQLLDVIMAEYDIAKGEQITTPVFLALGRYDYVCPYYLWDDVKDKLPNLSYNLFEKSGHYPMLEEQALFDKKLIAWIKSQ